MTHRVAFIGTGQMARAHLRALRQRALPITIVGVHDRTVAPAEEFAQDAGARAYPSAGALLAEARPDVVHVCTPPGAHFEAAAAALEGGAHVYVEKPFALTIGDATALLEKARIRGRLVCAGHQLLRDPAYEALTARAATLGAPVQIDSHFAFRPAGASAERRGARMLARQLLDILPHPLYALVAAMERYAPDAGRIELAWAHATPSDVQAMLCAGNLVGRLSVSVRARPVASYLTITGTRGALTCDFVRSIVIGAGNPGTEPLEKILNPVAEGAQMAGRTALSVGRRICSGTSYPGLAELVGAFYEAIAAHGPSPVAPSHLLRVTRIFQPLAARIETSADRCARPSPSATAKQAPPWLCEGEAGPASACGDGEAGRVVLTGARGFLGSEIARLLPHVRGIGRAGWPDAPMEEWIAADLSHGVPAGALAGASVVVHAAAATSGGFDAHQRNTIDATRHLLKAMSAAGATRLVLVSSLSVLRPPRTPWERQDEQTPRPADPRPLGAYTWGKCLQEELVEREAAALGIATRIIRPGALIDWDEPELPGLMGRRLFGQWHLGLGGPHLPIAVCDVKACAQAIAWCVTHFDEAPPVVHLLDPAVTTRRALIARLRVDGWNGRMLWVPISLLAAGLSTARLITSLAARRLPERLAVWSILRPRRYDTRAAEAMLGAAGVITDRVRAETSHFGPRVPAAVGQ
jgi:predicted dehydrogenase/nucleoside-diphosphate-sugar epimerase